jgi:hypothetical protein
MAENKLGPRGRKSKAPSGNQLINGLVNYQVSFDKAAFDHLIRSQGVAMTHYRAIPDPRGMSSRGDSHAVGTARQSVDGYIYKEAGTITAFFSNNSNNPKAAESSVLEHATAYITAPDFYDDKPECPVLFSPWDRLFLKDIEIRVVTSQELEASQTGIDILQFPATCVEHLIDAHGVEYIEGVDFEITTEGHIQWISQNRPGFDPELGRGRVFAVRFRYTPFFVVDRLLHEIRVSQVTNPRTNKRSLERMPYQVSVVREYVFRDMNRNNSKDENTDHSRFQDAPSPAGRMGPKDY